MTEFTYIVLVEDNPKDAELTMMALEEYNVSNEVVWLQDGAEALDYFYRQGAYTDRRAENPVVVLLDLKLPKVDGIEVLSRLKSDPELQNIPVVMLTSSREERDIIEGYNNGVNAYVVKPVDFQDFVEAVKITGLFWALHNEQCPTTDKTTAAGQDDRTND